jgi:hypothetical protein
LRSIRTAKRRSFNIDAPLGQPKEQFDARLQKRR